MWPRSQVFHFLGILKSEQRSVSEGQASPVERKEQVESGDTLFDGGPPHKLESLIGLIAPNQPNYAFRAFLAVLVGWLPIAVLCAFQDIIRGDGCFSSFASDYGVHARLLIALPLLIAAEAVCLPRLSEIARHFCDSGVIVPKDAPAFQRIARSTLSLRDSLSIELAVLVFALTIIVTLKLAIPPETLPAWHRIGAGLDARISPAGWWQDFVSMPILMIFLVAWLFRLSLWIRFLFLVSRLRLRIVPAHPDRAGGLKFVGYSAQAFWIVALAVAIIIAGLVANRVVHGGVSLIAFRYLVISLVVSTVCLFIAPLAVFTGALYEAKRRGILEYGALARNMGMQMEHKWLHRDVTPSALEASDFSATTDLYSIAANTYAMATLPLGLQNLVILVIATVLPFVPVLLLAVPMSVIFEKVVGKLL